MRVMSRVIALTVAATCLSVALLHRSSAMRSEVGEYAFRHDYILGTSLDLLVSAKSLAAAECCEQAVLQEIERLRRILSTYDPESEICRLERAGVAECSPELVDVLSLYDVWRLRTDGAINGQLNGLISLWKQAEKNGVEPATPALAAMVGEINQPGWSIEGASANGAALVRLSTRQPLNVNAIGRGYILGKAAEAGARVAGVERLLVDLGGDLALFDNNTRAPAWRLGVTAPGRPEANGPPLACIELTGGAVATSGDYQRCFQIGERRYSHILDPRSGRPAEGVAGATVVAADNATANALATSLCVLGAERGLKLIADTPGSECLLALADGRILHSAGWPKFAVAVPAALQGGAAEAGFWPQGYQVSITVTLPRIEGKKYRRPYVAVWLEDADKKPVRTLSIWGNDFRYQKDLSYWYRITQADRTLIKAVSRATRPPGQYQLVWDGTDDKGAPVAQGTYGVRVEVTREHGRHVQQTGSIECRQAKQRVELQKTAENDATVVEFGPRGE